MYLEISGRQTGKSTRLVDNVVSRILNGDRCIVFGFSSNWTHELNNKILSKLYNIVIEKPVTLHMPEFFVKREMYDRYLKHNPHIDEDDLYVYYDEFDMLSENNKMILSNNGYYVTTAIKTRTLEDRLLHAAGFKPDNLLDLEKMNNNMIVSIGRGFSFFEDFNNAKYLGETLDPETFDRDVDNIWNTYKS